MRTENINGHTVKFYETMDETPIKNYHLMNKYLMIDSDIGSNMGDVDRHMKDAILLLQAGDMEKSLEELSNLRQLFWLVLEEKNVTHLSFACLIHSIDGEVLTDLSERNLLDVIKTIDQQTNIADIGGDGDEPERRVPSLLSRIGSAILRRGRRSKKARDTEAQKD